MLARILNLAPASAYPQESNVNETTAVLVEDEEEDGKDKKEPQVDKHLQRQNISKRFY